MNVKSRLAKIEKSPRVSPPVAIRVWFSGGGYVERRDPGGQIIERLTDAEFEAQAKRNGDEVIQVSRETIEARGGYS
jgi:hypothetical protein